MTLIGLLRYLPDFLMQVTVFTLFAMGLNIQFGFAGLINFGHVAFLGIGAYATALLSIAGWPLWMSILAGMALAGLLSLAIGLPALRLRDDYLAIVTIGFAEIMRMIFLNEQWLTGGAQGVLDYPLPLSHLELSPVAYNYLLLALSVTIAAAAYFLLRHMTQSPWGRVLRGMREDEDAAQSLGKNTRSFKLQVLALGCVIAGLAGALLAFYLRYFNPRNFMPIVTFEAWIVMVIGGAGTNLGPILGGFIYYGLYALTQSWISQGFGPFSSPELGALRIALIGVVLILLMMYRPQGILGHKEELSLDR